jgi:hypothetical protein
MTRKSGQNPRDFDVREDARSVRSACIDACLFGHF